MLVRAAGPDDGCLARQPAFSYRTTKVRREDLGPAMRPDGHDQRVLASPETTDAPQDQAAVLDPNPAVHNDAAETIDRE